MVIYVKNNALSNADGTFVSIYARILHDEQVEWPMVGDIHCKLLNQLKNEKHHGEVLSFQWQNGFRPHMAAGLLAFIPHRDLGLNAERGTQYLKDHTLYLKVSAELEGKKSWLKRGIAK